MPPRENMHLPTILLVDDEEDILFSTQVMLKKAVPCKVQTISDSTRVMPYLEGQDVALVVLDLQMPGVTGQELLQMISYAYPNTPVLIVTAAHTVETAVDCMKLGASDYLLKPVEKGRLVASVVRALELFRLRNEVSSLRRHLLTGELQHEAAFAPIVTGNRKMRALFQYLESVACSEQPLLITGETGSGKELFAQAVHELCGKKGPFVAVNVAGLDEQMLSDALFGHRKGAFTGADQSREGLIARAENGTLFLDEIGEMSIAAQVKLLRLLQEKEYYPLGSDVAKHSNARIIAATNRDLAGMINTGEFRNDLFYGLGAHSCHIPPLRERLDDLPRLLDHFLESAAAQMGKKKPSRSDAVAAFLASYSFPGNVRELQAMIYDAVAQHQAGLLSPALFRNKIGREVSGARELPVPTEPTTAQDADVVFHGFPTLKEAEEFLTGRALALAGGNQGVAASLLGLTRTALNNRLSRKRELS